MSQRNDRSRNAQRLQHTPSEVVSRTKRTRRTQRTRSSFTLAHAATAAVLALCTAMFSFGQDGESPNDDRTASASASFDPALEVLSKRSANSKHYRNGDGSYTAVIANAVIHRQDEDGKWVDLDTEFSMLPQTQAPEGYDQIRRLHGFDVLLPLTPTGDYAIQVDGKLIQLSANSQLLFRTGTTEVLIPSVWKAMSTSSNNAALLGERPLLLADDQVLSGRTKVKHELVLREPSSLFATMGRGADVFIMRDEVILPEGWTMQAYEIGGTLRQGSVVDVIQLIDESGQTAGRFPQPVAYDENSESQLLGHYEVHQIDDNHWTIDTVFDAPWLLDDLRVYPIVIDPTYDYEEDFEETDEYNGRGWGWNGSYIGCEENPSNFYVKGRATDRSWIYWDVSSVPDNSHVSNVHVRLTIEDVQGPTSPILQFARMVYSPVAGCSFKWEDSGGSEYGSWYIPYSWEGSYREFSLTTPVSEDLEARINQVANAFGVGLNEAHNDSDSDENYIIRIDGADLASNSDAVLVFDYTEFDYTEPEVTSLSWRSGSSCSSGSRTTAEPGDTVYVRVQASNMNGETVTVDIRETDGFLGGGSDHEDYLDVLIENDCGTESWTIPCDGDKAEFILRHADTSDSAILDVDNGEASSPNPSNNASNVSVTTNLSWSVPSCNDQTELFFGTDSSPDSGESQGNVASPWNPPGNLSNSTTYYWKVKTKNDGEWTTGPTWSFSTEADPCDSQDASTPSNQSPSNNSQNVSISTNISWSSSGSCTSGFDVFLGPPVGPLQPVGSTPAHVTTFDLSGLLEYSTTYRWYVTAVNTSEGDNSSGSTWTFSTEPAPDPCDNVGAGAAYSPSPEDGANNVSLNPNLTWLQGTCTDYNELQFGTNPALGLNESYGEQSSPWSPPFELEPNTTYYWQVTTFNSGGWGAEGEVWSFTTEGDDPFGACCVGDTCSLETAADCAAIGGSYIGNDTSCVDNPCANPNEARPVTTVITHGYVAPGIWGSGDAEYPAWTDTMAEKILDRAQTIGLGTGSRYLYDIDTGGWVLTGGSGNTSGPIVLIVDWALQSDGGEEYNLSTAVADVFYAALRDPQGALEGVDLLQDRYLHLIGHSRGCSVNSEIARRLLSTGISVDHVTNLDSHPIDGDGYSECGPVTNDLGDLTPSNWAGINWSENFYRQDGEPDSMGGFYGCDPDGIPLDCDFECQLQEYVLDVDGSGYEGFANEHSDVHLWYLATIDHLSESVCEEDECIDGEELYDWFNMNGSGSGCDYDGDRSIAGYYHSRIVGGERQSNQSGNGNPTDVDDADILFNGTFEAVDEDGNPIGIGTKAGWVSHGGSMPLDLDYDENSDINNYYRVGRPGGYIYRARHSRFYIPENATYLTYSFAVLNLFSSDDIFSIHIEPVDGSSTDPLVVQVVGGSTGWMTRQHEIDAFRGKMCTIEFRVTYDDFLWSGIVGIDNVEIFTQTITHGPCCIAGICFDGYTYDECDSAGGQFHWGDNWCEEVDCDDLAMVACCMGEQCVQTTASNCSNTGGVSQGYNTNCDINPCLTSGACCMGSNCFDSWTSTYCDSAGGVFQGLGSTCDNDPCPEPTGACCVGTDCGMATQIGCSSVSGTWHQGASCSSELCGCETDDPEAPSTISSACLNNWVIVTGSYGYADYQWQYRRPGNANWTGYGGSSSINIRVWELGQWNFRYKRQDGDCEWSDWSPSTYTFVIDCAPADPTGACCSFGSCSTVTAYVCAQSGGEYQGDDIDCAESLCELPLGACCTQDGSCSELSEPDCLEYGGDYEGSNSECDTYPCDEVELETGACCILSSCLELTEDACSNIGNYQGDGTTCADELVDCTPDPYGACCLSFVACTLVTEDECLEMDGDYQGDDTACVTDTCAPEPEQDGACCIGVACLFDATEIACVNGGGVYQGNGTDCADIVCQPCDTATPDTPSAPMEACVSEVITVSAEIGHHDYRWQFRFPDDPSWNYLPVHEPSIDMVMHGVGEWIFRYRIRDLGCDWSPWSEASSGTSVMRCAASGACCVDGECLEDVEQADCAGTYFGDWSICSDFPACADSSNPTGACCIDESCSITTLETCFGEFYEGVTCATMPCEIIRGACCIDGTCYRTTEENCNGEYQGDDTVCWNNSCDAEPVLGACCIGSICEMLTFEACHGTWYENTTCEEQVCEGGEVIGPFQWLESEGGNGHWYAIYLEDPNEDATCWEDARALAEANAAYLVTFTTNNELNWWLATFAGYGESPYIGLWQNNASDSFAALGEPFGGWEWMTGEGLTLTNFAETAPDDVDGIEHYGRILTSGFWDDAQDCLGIGYAVEFGQSMNVCETCEFTTIQAAVDAAVDGSTIYVGAGNYVSTNGTSVVDFGGKNISLIGEGSDVTFMDGENTNNGLAWVMDIGESAEITGFTIGNCTTTGNGAAISVMGGALTITDCIFASNNATGAASSGGALSISGGADVILNECEFLNNTAVLTGGGVFIVDASTYVTINDTLFTSCTAGASGGAIFASESTNCTLDLCLFRNNEAASGGAVHINSLISSVSQCCFEDNIGGAIRHAGIDATVHECLFAANIYSESGSAIENFSGTMEIHHSNFVENDASGDGDAIFSSDGATTTITDCFFCGNSVDGDASTANYIAPFGDEDLFDLGNQFFTACATCQGDVNGDGVVDLGDMFAVMIASAFGGGDCPEGRYGYVDSGDLLELIDMLICRDRSCEVDCPGG